MPPLWLQNAVIFTVYGIVCAICGWVAACCLDEMWQILRGNKSPKVK